MNKIKLAINGGEPHINYPFAPFKSIGNEEVDAVCEVVKNGVLSAYIGASGPGFMGGPRVQEFERIAAEYFGVKHAIAVNSWTSGLIAAVGAIGIEPGDEIITTPWTMAATATSILHWNGIPVFADIDPDTFNISPQSVELQITSRTKAILSVDIFGQSANMSELRGIADKHNLKLIADTAQSPGARQNGKYAGSISDIGGFSLNYHKHIHCGEGGVIVTNDDYLAQRMCLIRNHAEAVIKTNSAEELSNMIGYNFRMGEMEAAISKIQLAKLDQRIDSRQNIAKMLNDGLSGLRGLKLPHVSAGSTHVYYVYGMVLDIDSLGISRIKIADALKSEGIQGLIVGYQNLHTLPLFLNKIAYGTNGFPWNSPYCDQNIEYGYGMCPIAERLHDHTFIGLNLCMYEYTTQDVGHLVGAFQKVWQNLDQLR